MFLCFSVAAGKDRFGEQIKLAEKPRDCKVSARDTNGAMCVFALTEAGAGPATGESVFLPRPVHAWACVSGRRG
jgi:hypothetical protein